MKLKLNRKETKKLFENGSVEVVRSGMTFLVENTEEGIKQQIINPYEGVSVVNFDAYYKIHCAYVDELHENQKPENQDFYIEGSTDNKRFEDYDEVKDFFDKMVATNETLIKLGKPNTFHLLELIQIDKKSGQKEVLESFKY